jgi:hypothetical protein
VPPRTLFAIASPHSAYYYLLRPQTWQLLSKLTLASPDLSLFSPSPLLAEPPPARMWSLTSSMLASAIPISTLCVRSGARSSSLLFLDTKSVRLDGFALLHYFDGYLTLRAGPLPLFVVIGGVVTEVGADVKNFAVGDVVGVGCFVDSCRTCLCCRRGVRC